MQKSFAPLVDSHSKILILGSLPGVQSLAANEYYANAQNHFWRIIFTIFGSPKETGYKGKCQLLLANKIALWDVAKSAERKGSLDSNIKNLAPNKIPGLLRKYPSIGFLLFNGAFAYTTYRRHFGEPALPFEKLLSTSPACAGRDAERLFMWQRAIKKGLALPQDLSDPF